MSEFECFWHHEVEPVEGAYQECFECKHVYQTEEELVTSYNTMPHHIGLATRGKEISFCPLCTHDW